MATTPNTATLTGEVTSLVKDLEEDRVIVGVEGDQFSQRIPVRVGSQLLVDLSLGDSLRVKISNEDSVDILEWAQFERPSYANKITFINEIRAQFDLPLKQAKSLADEVW